MEDSASLSGKPTLWEGLTRTAKQPVCDDPITCGEVVACGLGRVNVEPHRFVASFSGETLDNYFEQCGLAALSWSVQDEILLAIDDVLDIWPVDARKGGDVVVVGRLDRLW